MSTGTTSTGTTSTGTTSTGTTSTGTTSTGTTSTGTSSTGTTSTGTTSTGTTSTSTTLAGASSTGPVCEEMIAGYKYSTAFDISKKYNAETANECCQYCGQQPGITAWSWSISYRTCICQNSGSSADRQLHSDYICGRTSAATTSPATTSRPITTTAMGTTGLQERCRTVQGYKHAATYDVRKKYNVPDAEGCCDYCSLQVDTTCWAWSAQYQTCICQNPPASANVTVHDDFTSGLRCSGSWCPAAVCRVYREDWDYNNDFGSIVTPADSTTIGVRMASFDACCQSCANFVGAVDCNTFTFDRYRGLCFRKWVNVSAAIPDATRFQRKAGQQVGMFDRI
eukprot:TRINITY_DN1891_c0_g3_i2.p1 TRINITY_DN1891_c0_g3~~TRINITY_DN1891_c0_g3_i2.p1  ORF type:complete len:361 (-),score=98.77 TRINITY_DN1891_c0_g3_i2:277-1293(-)